jgi:hypothetical protein
LDLRELVLGVVDWIRVAQDRDRWRAVASTVMNIRVLAPQVSYLIRTQNCLRHVKNLSNVKLEKEEMKLLKRGLKYNLSFEPKNWLLKSCLGTETADTLVDPTRQRQLRYVVAEK